jgi:hypothetical protein
MHWAICPQKGYFDVGCWMRGRQMSNETVVDAMADRRSGQKLKAEEAKANAEAQQRRNRELRLSFYEKLTALDAGSIAVAVSIGIALIGKSEPHGFIHSNLSWLTAIASLFWASLVCALGHNYLFVRVSKLEVEQATAMSNFLALVSSHAECRAVGSVEVADAVAQAIIDSLSNRMKVDVVRATQIDRRLHQSSRLGSIAVGAFLLAYSLILIEVIRIWWMTR